MSKSYSIPKQIYTKAYPTAPQPSTKSVQISEDILFREILPYLDRDDAKVLCKLDKSIRDKICNDPNSQVWINLFQQHFSSDINIKNIVRGFYPHLGNTIMDAFFSAKKFFNEEQFLDAPKRLAAAIEYGMDRVVEQTLNQTKETSSDLVDDYVNHTFIGPEKSTLLNYAIESGPYVNTIKILLENGADTNIADARGITPLILAILKCDMVNNYQQFLYGHSDPSRVLQELSTEQATYALSIVQTLLEHGANVNHQDIQGNTPLLYALKRIKVSDCQKNIVNTLVEMGADVNLANKLNETPIKLGLYSDVLIRAGATPLTQSESNKRALETLLQSIEHRAIKETKSYSILRQQIKELKNMLRQMKVID